MARIMLVANPAASQFTGGDHRSILSLLARRHLVEAVWPRSAPDARIIAADAVTAGFDGVVAMGGDGIVHQVAQSLVGTDVFLGVIPAGTTNVFARQIGLPPKPAKAARHLAHDPHVESRAVLTLDGIDTAGASVVRHAVFAAGMGIDADVVAAAETEPYRKYRFGVVHYARTSVELLWTDLRRRQPTIAVEDGERSSDAIAVMAQFHDAFTYVGIRPLTFEGAPPAPVTLLIVENLRMRHLPSLLRHLALGRSLAGVTGIEVWPEVASWQARSDAGTRTQLDGELVGNLVAASFTYRPCALWVAGPPPRGDQSPSRRSNSASARLSSVAAAVAPARLRKTWRRGRPS
ncbi:diacylglycerol kinase family lipid kinase [soil metagenome]